MSLATDIAYRLPAVRSANAFKGKSLEYRFTQGNPWEGMFKGKSTHMPDATFLFQNFNEHMNDEENETDRRLAGDFLQFARGKAGAEWEEGLKRV